MYSQGQLCRLQRLIGSMSLTPATSPPILPELWLVCLCVAVLSVFYGCLRAIVTTLQLHIMCVCVKLQRCVSWLCIILSSVALVSVYLLVVMSSTCDTGQYFYYEISYFTVNQGLSIIWLRQYFEEPVNWTRVGLGGSKLCLAPPFWEAGHVAPGP